MKAVALYVNTLRPRAIETARTVAMLARGAGAHVHVCDGVADAIGVVSDAEFDDAEILVTIGGDGTLLRGARLAQPRGIALIGVNTGRLGFLTEIETNDDGYAELRRGFEAGFESDERVALHASVAGRDGMHFALNDVVVRRGAQARMVPFGVSLDGETIAHLPSDGVIIATPTGSTGYFLSAGGPIISPAVDAFGVAAILPHTLFARPLIVPTSSMIEITCDGEIARATLETDGQIVADLEAGDRVIVQRTPKPVRFARVRSHAFFSRLEDKLQWGVPIKR